MNKKIEIPRNPELGVVLTIIVDGGKTYHINQKVISDHMLKLGRNELEDVFSEHLGKMSHEMVEYLLKEGVIDRPN